MENTNIKPYLNLKWYHNEDLYSDGDVEDTIIDLIKNNPTGNFSKQIAANPSWPVYYHLTKLRSNILNWYPFYEDSSVLEIGCGMGAITSLLCERCKEVTAVELSKRRATATMLRCADRDNLEIIVGNLNDIEFEKKFDYITLIGVLEYQGHYTNSENPFVDFLEKIRGLLNPNGKLLIAIENKYGLKYWCGAPEDHTGVPFDGINQYRIGPKTAKTFSRAELKELILESGYKDTYFYYPMPDYKMPTVIYSEKYQPLRNVSENIYPYHTGSASLIADEMHIYNDIIKNNVYEFFANSFLVECSCQPDISERVTFATVSNERAREYEVITTITSDKKVYKTPLHSEGVNHIQQSLLNQQELSDRGLKMLMAERDKQSMVSSFIDAPLLSDVLLKEYRDKNTTEIIRIWDMLFEQIQQSAEETADNVLLQLNLITDASQVEFGKLLKKGYLDMVTHNCFYCDGELVWFDQEWSLENVPAGVIMYKNLLEVYNKNSWFDDVITYESILMRYNLLDKMELYHSFLDLFSASVLDAQHIITAKRFRTVPEDTYTNNILKLLKK